MPQKLLARKPPTSTTSPPLETSPASASAPFATSSSSSRFSGSFTAQWTTRPSSGTSWRSHQYHLGFETLEASSIFSLWRFWCALLVPRICACCAAHFTSANNFLIYCELMAGQVTKSRRLETQQQEQSRARWTTSLTKMLAELMVDQVHKGNKHNNLFNKKAWKHICDEFYNKTGLKWDKEQLKNRYSVLRRQYTTVKSILDQSDFTWDDATGSITANDEIWAEYIKKHPDAETVKSGGCPIFKELCAIFSEPATNGKHEYLATSEGEHTSRTPCPELLSTHQEESSSGSQDEEDANDPETIQPTTPTATCNRKRGRKGIDDAIAEAILEMAAASKMRAAAIEQYNARYSMADCIKDLDLMQGVDQQLYFAALDMFNKPNAREIFLSLKKDKRLTWLRGKCAVASNNIG